MKKTIKNSFKILVCMLVFISCEEYLDVQPDDKYIEEIVFSKEISIQNAINGIYMKMTEIDSYGGQLTMSTVDVLAQRYNAYSDSHKYYDLAHYNYNQTSIKEDFDAIWTNMYVRILEINNTIEKLEINDANIPLERLNVLKGEMIGLRAMLHFDLLRLFGPIYSVNPSAKSLPYQNSTSTEIKPLLPASEFIENILEDLTLSINYLNDDPVKEYGKIAIPEQDDDTSGFEGTSFYRYRNLRFNYFAAKALQARVHLYAGNNLEANAAAKEVIDEGTKWFNWVDLNDVIAPGTNSPDRIFSSEVLFSLYNSNLYNRQATFFGSSLVNSEILAPLPTRLDATFNQNTNDIRYHSSSWKLPSDGSKTFKTFLKFSEVQSGDSFIYMQPLIRMSEMYFIAAETSVDINVATDFLNAVRLHRGIPNLDPANIDIDTELLNAYKREFYGEGQLFYFYKRKNMSAIENGSVETGDVPMSEATYVLPLPESETDYRQ
ncbi:RagB/SusD family nutrient uptake outer membrane protein [Lutibacter sp. HS1-25]|uniref:RagB/SusD family nutrient uptake outer membrane protein n=1 Tax=Lutibacter sp. HS1-25 TaxID=2485000 RepID=UPI0013E90292|nr:RagB/SusD family nutrient uptake outer membrane protein [Lutibacter sp. HS1-25]